MKNSPLRLEKYFFTVVSIRANPDGSPEAKWAVEASPQCISQENKRTWAVSLRLSVKPAGEAKPTYLAEVEIAGKFSVEESWPEERIEQLVHANASAILYSTAREMISSITSRGPWPMLLLPSVSFTDTAPKTAAK